MMINLSRNAVRLVRAAGFFVVAASTAACNETAGSSGTRLVERTFASMGTELRLTAWTTDEAGAVDAFKEIVQEFDRLEALLSNWREDSDVQRLNAAAGKHPVPVGTDFRDVIRTARQVSEWTGGKFDVTFGVMAGLWKFDYQNKDGTVPEHREI